MSCKSLGISKNKALLIYLQEVNHNFGTIQVFFED